MVSTEVETLWLLALPSKCQSLSPFILLLLLFVVLLFWAHPGGPAWAHYKFLHSSTRPTIPGPNGLPIIGSINLMLSLPHRNIAAAAQSCRAKRLMAFSLGRTRVIVTCHPTVAKHILNSATFSDRPVNETAYGLLFNRSMGFAPYGVYWTTLRKIASAHLFSPNQIRASEQQRLVIANQMVEILSSSDDLCIRDLLKPAALSSMIWSLFGRKYDVAAVDSELKELVDEGYDLLGKVNWSDHLPFLADLDLQKIRLRCSNIVPRVKRLVGQIIAEHKEKTAGQTNLDFVDILLSQKGTDKLSDSDTIAVLWEMIFRGTDTVAILIEWVLARLVMHPDIQSKVHEELDRVVGRSRAVTHSDIADLVYLTAVIKEVFRLHPPGPLLSWARLSIRDSVIDGYHVPAGTTAMVNMWAIMRDPEFWDDALTFKPERFLCQSLNLKLEKDLLMAPFGSGRRSCPGKTMGMATINLWVATLLHEFHFVNYGQRVDFSEVMRLSCEMAKPLKIKVRPRRYVSN